MDHSDLVVREEDLRDGRRAIARVAQGIVSSTGRLSAAEVVQHAVVVQEVMRAVMKQDVHYGTIPGTPKPTLYQPGADVLCMTFRIAAEFDEKDLSTDDVIRYRITCRGVHQGTGIVLGTGIGEASSGEDKYKWRKAVSDKEFDATPPALRRIKYGKSWETRQVRTEPADLANTILKMAAKRAKIAMVLNVTAASDMFGQDLDDLDGVLQEHFASGHEQPVQQPQQQGPAVWPADKFAEQLVRWKKAIAAGMKSHDDIVALARTKGDLTVEQVDAIRSAPGPAPDPKTAAPTEGDQE